MTAGTTTTTVDVAGAADLLGLSAKVVRARVAERSKAARVRSYHFPAPTGRGEFDRDEIELYGWRMGLLPYDGRAVIGYAGMAYRLGCEDQTLRKARRRTRMRSDAGRVVVAWPAVVAKVGRPGRSWLLFDEPQAMRWAAKTGWLDPAEDGRPQRPRRSGGRRSTPARAP